MIMCNFAIPAAVSNGNWDVVVSNSDGTTGTKAAGFSITVPPSANAPIITSLSPATGVAGTTTGWITLSGTNYRSGATVKLQKPGQSDITSGSVWVYGSTMIMCNFAIPVTATKGSWDIVVTNSDGTTGMKAAGFTIL
jgi:hypothetical protein